MSLPQTLHVLSTTTALLSSGGIAAFSIFCVPLLTSQPASRSLPGIRWLFSRGSHVFPTTAILSSLGYATLAYLSLPPTTGSSGILQRTDFTSYAKELLHHATTGRTGLYLLASGLCISIAPFTQVMIPTNFTLIAKNEALGGSQSEKSARYREEIGAEPRSAEESTSNVEDVSEWTDGSGPQGRTKREAGEEEEREVKALLEKFGALNMVRAVLMALGGVVGLVAGMR